LQRVLAVWPSINAHPLWSQPDPPAAYAVLLSPQARLVRVVTPLDTSPNLSAGLPHIIPTNIQTGLDQTGGIIQWLHQPAANLPRVLTPPASGRFLRRASSR
jgi:hypothetical protein